MWDSPYQASRVFTLRTVPASDAPAGARVAIVTSGMTGSQISFLDALVLRQLAVVSLCEHLAAGQDGDAVGQVRDDAEIMLDHQDGLFGGDALDQRGDLVDVLMAHASHWLVQQH